MGERRTIGYPLLVAPDGRTATVEPWVEVEQLIEQLLFTTPGERLNRPSLGCGLMDLVFDGASPELRVATQFEVQTSLQRWLGDLIHVAAVAVVATGPELEVTVRYRMLDAAQWRTVVLRS